MKTSTALPVSKTTGDFLAPDALAEMVQAADASRFDCLAVTDHPAGRLAGHQRAPSPGPLRDAGLRSRVKVALPTSSRSEWLEARSCRNC